MTTGFGFCATCGTPRTAAEQKFCPTCGSAFAVGVSPALPGALVAGPAPAMAPASAAPFAPAATSVVPSGVNNAAVGVVAAGVLIGSAAFLPWETVLGVGVNGLNVGTGGSIALVLGLLIGLLGLTQMNGRGMGSGSRLLALLGGLAALGLAIIAGAELNNQTSANNGLSYFGLSYAVVPVSVGIGVFVVAIGGALAIGAALVARRRNS
jgi:hypothetical protein